MKFLESTKTYVFDIECYPNFFSCVVRHFASGERWIFEVSDWVNNAAEFVKFMQALSYHDCQLIGFNNFYYDWQVIEHCLSIGPTFTAADAYERSKLIIEGCATCAGCRRGAKCDTAFQKTVWGKQQTVKQVDLYLIPHFDNFAKSTSLKELEFNMRSRNVGDLPITPGIPIEYNMRKPLIDYNCEDVDETEKFAEHMSSAIDFRTNLIPTMGYDVMNYNDTKIGKKFFEQELKARAPHLLGGRGEKRQTRRDYIRLSDVIISKIEFETPELQGILTFLKNTVLTQTKAPPELKGLSATLQGFTMHVGAGGGHGSVGRQCVRPEPGWKLIDVDVASYYPNLAIANRFYPAHLSEDFCDIYEDVYERRKATAKKSPENAMFKLALNGVYGDSANEHSIFLDPQYTMQITINGQLLLYLLTEKILMNTNAKMIQLNTDGITFLVPANEEFMARRVCEWWEQFTGLTLEYADYEAMWIRDVNSYVAKTVGTPDNPSYCKRIGAYAFETARENPGTREVPWHKDHSALVVQKAACAEMVDGIPVRQFIYNHGDAFDFMLRQKTGGKTWARVIGDDEIDPDPNNPSAGQKLQKMTRYYMAKNGKAMQKIHPPLRKAPEKQRIIGVHVGWKVAICDDLSDFDPHNIDYEWYVSEAEKLVIR